MAIAPARLTARSAAASAPGMSWMYGTSRTQSGEPARASSSDIPEKCAGPLAQSS